MRLLVTFCTVGLDLFVLFWHGESFDYIKSQFFFECAEHYQKKKDYERAISYYNRSLIFNCKNQYAQWGLASVLGEKGDFRKAVDYINQLPYSKDTDLTRYILLAVIFESLEETKLLNEALQKIIETLNGNKALLYRHLAYTYLNIGNFKKAEYYGLEGIIHFPRNAVLYCHLGKIYLAQNKLKEAREQFIKVVELSSDINYKKAAVKTIKKLSNDIKKNNAAE